MRIISCASYYGSGSSAITDLVSEFDGVHSFTDEEFRFVHDPDGISDLEFKLVENFNRHNSGHALKRYKHFVDHNAGGLFGAKYENYFNGKWKEISYEYIERLTDFKYNGWWHYDFYDKSFFYHFRKRIVNKLLHMTIWRNQPDKVFNTMKDEITYCSHPTEERFLNETRRYIDKLFSVACNGAEIVMVDQVVPSTNLKRHIRYFNDIKVAVVDRDPRDIFVLEKYVWKDGVIPTDVELFCKWFKYTRDHRKTDNLNTDSIQYVQFEDLIYKYDETVSRLAKWLELSLEVWNRKKTHFIPERSINNTQVWKTMKCDLDEVAYIERELSEYLYDFPEK